MESPKAKFDVKELLSPSIEKNCSRFLEILEQFDSTFPTREEALILKKAFALQKNPVLSFLLKKSFRLALFKLKKTSFKISMDGLEKLLKAPDRLDDLALAITTLNAADAFIASDYFKQVNWKTYPTEILPCFCIYFKNFGNFTDLDDLFELTRHPNPVVIAAAVEAIKRHDTGSLRAIVEPLIQNQSTQVNTEAIENLYIENRNHDSNNIANQSREYFKENRELLLESLKSNNSELEKIRILRLIKKFGNVEDAEFVKPLLIKEKPDVVRAAIKVLERLDADYLCIYLPQLLQDKSAKVRLTATRAFQHIDKSSVVSLVLNMISSLNAKQRGIAITTAMLVDFSQVRTALLTAFGAESNAELLENLSLVLAANPDRDLVKDMYIAHKTSKTLLRNERVKAIEMVSEKVSIALNNSVWPKELMKEAEDNYKSLIEASKNDALQAVSAPVKNTPSTKTAGTQSKPVINSKASKNATAALFTKNPRKIEKTAEENQESEKKSGFLDSIGWNKYSTKAKIMMVMIPLIVIAWTLMIILVIFKLLF